MLFEVATGVGITQTALGHGPTLIRQALFDRAHGGGSIDMSVLRPRYEPAFEMFKDALPVALRQSGTALLRQLCDPEPDRRLPRVSMGRRGLRTDGLDWLLRQADILSRQLATGARARPPRAKAAS